MSGRLILASYRMKTGQFSSVSISTEDNCPLPHLVYEPSQLVVLFDTQVCQAARLQLYVLNFVVASIIFLVRSRVQRSDS